MADRRDAIIKSFDVAVDKPMVPAFVCVCVSPVSVGSICRRTMIRYVSAILATVVRAA